MSRTAQLSLPLLLPAQAQKHVTVNEALARLDAAIQLRVVSSQRTEPPASGTDGESYIVPVGASGAWANASPRIATWSNGGWIIVSPKVGWRAWDESRSGYQTFDGVTWLPDALAVSPGGASILCRIIEFDHTVSTGATNLTSITIPTHAQVVGVTGRVLTSLQGPGLAGWRAGVPGSDNRYGSGLGVAANSYLIGLTGAPVTYYAPTPLLISAEGGTFASGRLRLAIHVVQLSAPRAA